MDLVDGLVPSLLCGTKMEGSDLATGRLSARH